jgi:cyclophilin family peptidyl-prolyl cis-trans isomerase
VFKQIQMTLLCGAVGLMVGCFQESSGGGAFSLEEEPEATSQPASKPADLMVTEEPPAPTTMTAATQEIGRKIRAVIETNFGHMEVELYPDQAPATVANFIRLAKSGFYDNLPCHRMVPGFIVQLGKPIDPAKARELEPIKGEFSQTLKHEGGTLSMARRPSDPDSATSQFFICFAPRNDVQRRELAKLDGQFAIFGKVIHGMDVLDAIEAVPTEMQPMGPGRNEKSKPAKTILLRSVRISE